jgi:carbamoyltransferase
MSTENQTLYVGISCTGHDNAVALLDAEGAVLYAQSAERDYQTKLAYNMAADEPVRLKRLLSKYSRACSRIVVCKPWASDLQVRMAKEIDYLTGDKNDSPPLLKHACVQWHQRLTEHLTGISLPNTSVAGMGVRHAAYELGIPVEMRSYDHHRAHATYACYTSPFRDAACLVVDGFSEDRSQSLFAFESAVLREVDFPSYAGCYNRIVSSLGLFYGLTVCTLCGFRPFFGEEWKVMGLAPYGKLDKDILDELRKLIGVQQGVVTMPSTAAHAFLSLFNSRCSYAEQPARCADLAYTAQYHFSELMLQILEYVHDVTGSSRLVLSGGCALNSSFNGKILEASPFTDLYVPPGPGDEGTAVGAAILAVHQDSGSPQAIAMSPYIGDSVDESAVVEFIEKSGGFPRARKLPYEELYRTTAEELAAGRIVGWVQGRAEFGPRALGNRSILADARGTGMKEKINKAVKYREAFRPFAPAILHERGSEFFSNYHYTPFMEKTLIFKPEVRHLVPAVCHEDNTGRAQSVTEENNAHFYRLLRAFEERTGVPLLLNTSLNVMGKPIVSTFNDAMMTFLTTDLDVLVFGQYLFRKGDGAAALALDGAS